MNIEREIKRLSDLIERWIDAGADADLSKDFRAGGKKQREISGGLENLENNLKKFFKLGTK